MTQLAAAGSPWIHLHPEGCMGGNPARTFFPAGAEGNSWRQKYRNSAKERFFEYLLKFEMRSNNLLSASHRLRMPGTHDGHSQPAVHHSGCETHFNVLVKLQNWALSERHLLDVPRSQIALRDWVLVPFGAG